MSDKYIVEVKWACDEPAVFAKNKYSRAHSWVFDGGAVVEASSSPHIVPLPYSVESHVDPEEAFIASLSSCHMLFFLSLARAKSLVVKAYTDTAEGCMTTNEEGRTAITEVILKPTVVFDGSEPSQEMIDAIHHEAHDLCFIANSVRSEIKIEPQLV